MAFTSRKEISFKSLCLVILCLWLHGNKINGDGSSFKLYRSECDIFTNLDYGKSLTGSSGTTNQCLRYGAECYNKQHCRYCRCSYGRNTYITSDADEMKGECKRDEDIVPESVPSEKYWLKNNRHSKCLKVDESGRVIGTDCLSHTLDMLWIWTNEELMNVRTLKCMDDGVYMSQCPQSIMGCHKNQQGNLKWYRWLSLTNMPYLHLQKYSNSEYYATSWTKQLWISNETNFCDSTTYTGCYRFSDGSFMKYLSHTEYNTKLEISAPIFYSGHDCTLSKTFRFIRHGEEWKTSTDKIPFSIENIGDRVILQVAKEDEFNAWNGSLLNLTVVCGNEKHCVLVKLASSPAYPDEIINSTSSPFPKTTSTEEPTSDSETITEDMEGSAVTSTIPQSSTKKQSSTTKNSEESAREETSESGGTNSAAIAVTATLLLVAMAIGFGYLVLYRRRKKSQVQQNNNNDIGVVNYSKEIYEDPNRTYETLDGLSTNQPGTTDAYSYPDSNIIPNTTPSQQEYTYAKDTDFPRSSLSAKAAAEVPKSDAGYEALKQPNDDFYHYPDNTNSAKAPSSKLEYTYAKDTDIPRGNPGTTVGTQDPTNNAVYHTLEQPDQTNDDYYHYPDKPTIAKPPSSELKYTYAKDTEIPRVTPDQRKKMPQTTNNAVYHTLEQPDQLNDDYYHYPDQPTITKPPSSELEYTYAKDTEIPRVNADKRDAEPQTTNNAVYHTLEDKPPTTSPGTKIPSELEYAYAKNTELPKSLGSAPSASGALYNTPGQEIPTPTKPEYSYAKNTDMPSIQLPTKQTTNEHSSLPDNSGLYHTLEKPNSPQALVYSTLEGPENEGTF